MSVSVGTIHATLALKDRMTGPLMLATKGLGKFGAAGRALGVVGKAMGLAAAAVVGASVAMIKSASDFESSFTGVIKTVSATDAELRALAAGFRQMAKEIPLSVEELNKIGESAGQLGVKTENILEFTRTMAALGVTTNLSTEKAATSLARMANIMDNEAGPQYERMGSAIVELGNNLATTEAEIVEFGLRIAGAGKIAGLTEAQIFAIGGAMSSIGVKANAGGTSVQKVLNRMTQSVAQTNEELTIFAHTAGLTAEEFARVFRDDAGQAFTLFVEGLKTQGEGAFQTLEDLSLQNERVIRSFIGLAQAGGLLRSSLKMSSEASSENLALMKEAALRYSTFESHITILKNVINDLAITGGQILLPVIQSITGDLTKMGSTTQFTERAVSFMVKAFLVSLDVIKMVVVGWYRFKQGMLLVGVGLKFLMLLLVQASSGIVKLANKFGLLEGELEGLAEMEDKLAQDMVDMGHEFSKAGDTAEWFGGKIDDVKGEIQENAVAAKANAVASSDFREAQKLAGETLEVTTSAMDMWNDSMRAAPPLSEEAREKLEAHREEVRKLADEFAGLDLVEDLGKITEAYELLAKDGDVSADATARVAEALIALEDAGQPIPQRFAEIVQTYKDTTAETERMDDATKLAKSTFDRFSLEGPRKQADALISEYTKLKGAGELNVWQQEQLGKAAAALQVILGDSLGPELDGLAGRYGKHTTVQIPSLRDAIGDLADGFANMSKIARGSFGGVMKKAAEAVTKIDLVFNSVNTLKTAFQKINDFFVGGGWNQLKGALTSVVGYLKNARGGADTLTSSIGSSAKAALGAGKNFTGMGAEAASAAVSTTASFASIAAGVGAAAVVAIGLWKVIGGKSGAQLAGEYQTYLQAGGDKALSAERMAKARFSSAQAKAEQGGRGSFEEMGEGEVDETAMQKAGRARHRHSQLTRAGHEATRLRVKAVEMRKAGKSNDEIDEILRQRTMLLSVTQMRTRGGAGIEEKIVAQMGANNFGQFAFAKGGIVTSPTVGLLGEAGPEAVIPLNKMRAMGDEQLLTEMRGLRSELRLLPLHLRDAILLAQ